MHVHIESESPTPDLDKKIESQRRHGGRLIAYQRCWAAILVSVSQVRIEWVPPYANRCFAGWRHSVFTLLLGIWGVSLLFTVPMVLLQNFRGGVDVTEFYSTSSIDLLRVNPPIAGTAKRDEKAGQMLFLAFLLLVLAFILYHLFQVWGPFVEDVKQFEETR